MGGAREEGTKGQCAVPLTLLPVAPGKILTVIKCPLVTIHMPRFDLFDVFSQDNTDICDLFVFLNIKMQANLQVD